MTVSLPPDLRSLVRCKIAIWPGAWEALGAELRSARSAGFARSGYEETLLQAVLFYGFPRIVTAFEVLTREWPTAAAPAGGALPRAEQTAAGEGLFAAIYGKNTNAVHALLRGFHGEFHDFVLEAAYGRVLTRPGLAPLAREVLAVAALATMQQIPQLVAHARGALHFGADDEGLDEVMHLAGLDPATARSVLTRARGGSSA